MTNSTCLDAMLFQKKVKDYLNCREYRLHLMAFTLEEKIIFMLRGPYGTTRKKDLQKFIDRARGIKGVEDLKRILREVGGISVNP